MFPCVTYLSCQHKHSRDRQKCLCLVKTWQKPLCAGCYVWQRHTLPELVPHCCLEATMHVQVGRSCWMRPGTQVRLPISSPPMQPAQVMYLPAMTRRCQTR